MEQEEFLRKCEGVCFLWQNGSNNHLRPQCLTPLQKSSSMLFVFSPLEKIQKQRKNQNINLLSFVKKFSMTLIWFRLLSTGKIWRYSLFLFCLSLEVIQIFQDCAIWLNVLNVTSYDASPYISRSKK